MADREKVMKWLELCANSCFGEEFISEKMARSILELLKEQEAVEPKHNPLSPSEWFCGKCWMCISRFHDYCPSCGRKVKWK